ncbi:MAG: alpha-hydroxy-acid oxidizing protein, partial [Bacteroidetes bacterium]|nr:alpha-hydroxy-acid oxidizing protein [Bacteroidota bacterium]
GGAGTERTISENRQAFERWKIVPRMLRDVSQRDTSVEILGQTIPYPLLLSPVGVLEMVHPKADIAVAKAAAETGIPYIFSNQASRSMEDCASVMGDSPHWFQLYWSKSDELVTSFVQRAEACGSKAIVVTLDTTLLGWRMQDLDLAYLPFLRGKGIAQYISDPVFNQLIEEPPVGPPPERKITLSSISMLLELVRSYPGSFFKNLRSGKPLASVRKFIEIYSRPSLTWENLSFLRGITQLPILLKGILHPDDARKALDMGMDGLIVSNHGGRQVDGAISSFGALPAIAEAVNGKVPVLLDSGVRSGADIFKAIALGANSVCIGRPYVYGLTLAGQQGVKEVINNITADFELTMGLAGCKNISEIHKDLLVRI